MSTAHHLYLNKDAVKRAVAVYQNRDPKKRLKCSSGDKCAAIRYLGHVAYLEAENVDEEGKPGLCANCKNRKEKDSETRLDRITPRPHMRKRYCLYGHDTWRWGRTNQGACKKCKSITRRTDPRGKRYCVRGHDTWECGRTPARVCKECRRLQKLPDHNMRRDWTKLPGLNAARQSAGLTYWEFAEATGFSENTLKNYLRGRTRVPVDRAMVMAEALGTTVEELEKGAD
jgi:lambda repressor-like predicted transcriptional regulator